MLCWNPRILFAFFLSSLPVFSIFLSSSCLHFSYGYPPCYKPRPRNNSTYSNNNTVVNQESNQSFSNSAVKTDQLGGVGEFIQNLNLN